MPLKLSLVIETKSIKCITRLHRQSYSIYIDCTILLQLILAIEIKNVYIFEIEDIYWEINGVQRNL